MLADMKSKTIHDQEYEIRRLNRRIEYLEALTLALKSGGGEIDNFTSPKQPPFDGSKVYLWIDGPGWWPDAQVWRNGVFVQPVDGGMELCGAAAQDAQLWRPAKST